MENDILQNILVSRKISNFFTIAFSKEMELLTLLSTYVGKYVKNWGLEIHLIKVLPYVFLGTISRPYFSNFSISLLENLWSSCCTFPKLCNIYRFAVLYPRECYFLIDGFWQKYQCWDLNQIKTWCILCFCRTALSHRKKTRFNHSIKFYQSSDKN